MIKINLVREGRAVRGGGVAAPTPAVAAAQAAAGANTNNILILAFVGVSILAAAGWWFVENGKLKDRQEQATIKQAEAQKLEAIIRDVENYQKRKDNLQKRIDLINQLKQNQKGPVRIMDRISQDLPDLVWLDKMTMAGGMISLSGRGLNPNAVANFVDNIKNDPTFEEPELGHLTMISGSPLIYSFDMNFHFSYAPKETAGSTTTGATATGTPASTSTTTTTTSGTAAPGRPGGARP